TQCSRLLREVDQEVVLAPLVHQGTFGDLGIPQHVVVASGDDGYHGLPRLYAEGRQRRRSQGPGRLGDAALRLVHRRRLAAVRTLGDGDQLGGAGSHARVGVLAGPAGGGTVHERVDLLEGDRTTVGEGGRHAGGATRLDADDPTVGV